MHADCFKRYVESVAAVSPARAIVQMGQTTRGSSLRQPPTDIRGGPRLDDAARARFVMSLDSAFPIGGQSPRIGTAFPEGAVASAVDTTTTSREELDRAAEPEVQARASGPLGGIDVNQRRTRPLASTSRDQRSARPSSRSTRGRRSSRTAEARLEACPFDIVCPTCRCVFTGQIQPLLEKAECCTQ
ncbi:unnamed protein product, partial [Amoebophrya sp. A25]|eukprot:GSA25T00022729001.1